MFLLGMTSLWTQSLPKGRPRCWQIGPNRGLGWNGVCDCGTEENARPGHQQKDMENENTWPQGPFESPDFFFFFSSSAAYIRFSGALCFLAHDSFLFPFLHLKKEEEKQGEGRGAVPTISLPSPREAASLRRSQS